MRRRTALALLGIGAAVLVLPPLVRRLRAPALAFEPLPGVPGFRRVAGGDVSGGDPAMIGLDEALQDTPPQDICADLFAAGTPADHVPIAYFSDARCVFCRALSPMLHEIEDSDPVRITWHELPLLGPASRRAARASLAARRQGAYQVFHDRLMGTPIVPNDAYLRRIATDAGIDGDRLLDDMASDAVTDQLARTARLARLFGFYGTPALVVGRTALLGSVEKWQLRRLIEMEGTSSEPAPCT
jgi:protein-disulfide isomerase